jgi:[ribosomal protein S5]-alanine N-acetyltransferase
MQMQLKPIELHVDKSNEIYGSDDCQFLLKTYDEYYEKIGYNLPWVGYFVIKENQIVGSCGFTGQPKDGKVEIAYWTFEEYQQQGVSNFACKELVLISQQTDPSIIITAKTAPEHNASSKILQNNGFTFDEIVKDDEIGDAWLWTLKKVKINLH